MVDFNASDPDVNPVLAFALVDLNSTTQNHLFTLDQNGTLRTATTFDFETNATTYNLRIRVTDQHFTYREEEFVLTLLDDDEAPYFTFFADPQATSTLLNRYENRTNVALIQASDHEPGSLSYSITGGADQSIFQIDSSSGLLQFIDPPDFETPLDSDADNIYLVTVQASDGTHFITHDLNVSITNTNEAPQVEILPTLGITGQSVILEGNLTSFAGGTLPNITLQYDSDANFSSNRVLQAFTSSVGNKLALWLDANDTSTLVNLDGNLSQWNDKSGNNQHLIQDTNSSMPKIGIHQHNGKNVITFDGDDYLRRDNSNILNTDLTCFIVARVDSGGIDHGGDSIISYGYGGNGRWEIRAGSLSAFNSKIAKKFNLVAHGRNFGFSRFVSSFHAPFRSKWFDLFKLGKWQSSECRDQRSS